MTRRELKQIASILPDAPEAEEERAYKLTTLLNMAQPPITGKTRAIEQETPLFGGTPTTEQPQLFGTDEEQ